MEELILKGIPCSAGISIGNSVLIEKVTNNISKIKINKSDVAEELLKFYTNINSIVSGFKKLINELSTRDEIAKTIIDANIMILSDKFLRESIINKIEKGFSAQYSIKIEFEKQENILLNTNDKILKEKSIELKNLKNKLLLKFDEHSNTIVLRKDSIVISKSVSTSDLFKFRKYNIAGFITEEGGLTSHASILARSFEIPSVIAAKDICNIANPDNEIVINGFNGKIVLNPNIKTKRDILKSIKGISEHKLKLGKLVNLKTKTKDDKDITLSANIEIMEDVSKALINSAEAIGLVRTENTFNLEKDLLDEEKQYNTYKNILESAYPKNVTFRLFDFGSDKLIAGINNEEDNPALGLRGIRFLLENPNILNIQLRALLKAGANKNLKIMLPMINSLSEIEKTKIFINDISKQYEKEEIGYCSNCPLGIMIETPASVLMSEDLAKKVDFFSIGTNDLVQYLLASDRINEKVIKYYDIFNPSIYKAIDFVVKNANKTDIKVSICGELAGDIRFTKLLVGLGIDEFSVTSSKLLELKDEILNIKIEEAKEFSNVIIKMSNSQELEDKLLKNSNQY